MGDYNREDLEKVAEATAKKTVGELMIKFGFDVDDVRGSQADFLHLRKHRLASEQVGKMAWHTIMGLTIAGFFSAVLLGVATYFKS